MLTFWWASTLFRRMEIWASQFRAARALLGKDQETVASWLGLDRREVSRWEGAKYKLLSTDAVNLTKAYEKNGIEFIQASESRGAGVRWLEPGIEDRHRGAQFRAARAMADLSMRDMQIFGVNRNFITRLERRELGALNLTYIRLLETALRQNRVELVPESKNWGAGVRWIVPDPYLSR